MSVEVIKDQEVFEEAVEILLEHLGPAKMVRLWSNWQSGGGDYLRLRDELFGDESVEHLYEAIRAYQQRGDESSQ